MLDNEDRIYMQRALELAARAVGRTNPNPLVGAVIVKDGRIIGEGYHKQAGTPHAEIHALNAAGDQASGATIYVSLEPCSHYGKTPPCADALIKAGIKRAVVATLDPNPKVAGNGIKKLRAAGIEVELGLMQEEAVKLNEVFFKHISTEMPFLALKTAMTMDGKIASSTGDSKWVTSEEARGFVHQLRNSYDGIMVGIGTVIADDPMLNTRLEIEDKRDPIRIILDTKLDIPMQSRIVASSREQRTLVFCNSTASGTKEEALKAMGVEVLRLNTDLEELPVKYILERLYAMGICSILLEGGGEVNASMLQEGLVDKVYWFIAPKIIGGRTAKGPIGGEGISLMKNALHLSSTKIDKFDEDILITGYLHN